jgi:hypothetical protein
MAVCKNNKNEQDEYCVTFRDFIANVSRKMKTEIITNKTDVAQASVKALLDASVDTLSGYIKKKMGVTDEKSIDDNSCSCKK